MKKLLFILPVAALIGGAVWFSQQNSQSDYPYIAHINGRLELARMDIASLYAGRVETIAVNEGQMVEKEALLAVLSSTTTQAQLSAAQAQQAQAEQAVIRAQAQIEAQQQQLKVAEMDLQNAQKMRRGNLISQSELEKRQAEREAANAALQAVRAAKREAEAAVQQAKAQVAQVGSVDQDMTVRAPQAGRVEYKIAEVGNVIPAGGKVVSLLNLDDVSMNLFFPAPTVNKIALNSEARIVLDGSDFVFPATVTYIAADAQFTPKYVETQAEREKLVFKVKLQIPPPIARQYSAYLRGGMTGNGYVLTDGSAQWPDELQPKFPQ
ncbi:HlyD family secretion protein [Pasteurella testudinis DSM 23072]|uniref:HlyD family secretion protein n=1 Tax=Pasteurella testudinis DSM 23072 TaxID=1122938 RepID=A0A1W1UIF8_9PAST|nr:HlyD family efflux transporter periplasmic adaptor subunit [Pasteurella testudinis]SMB80822.1 HlyD family secretion protein [Pasteurella testudinis DSM 23072]SUB52299.1 protein YhiI [Pasteurella testudinis]